MRSMMNASDDEITAAFAQERRVNETAHDGPLNENVRLVLQCLEDRGGTGGSFPMWMEGVPDTAVALGFASRIVPEGGGWVQYEITEAGKSALKDANRVLGDGATRYVHEVKYFGGLNPVVFGYPFLWPLSAPIREIDGSLCADRRVIAKPISLLKYLFS